jgi:hypothetical protein
MARTDRALTSWGKSFWVVIFVLLALHGHDRLNQEQIALAQTPQPTQKPVTTKSKNPGIIDKIVKLLQPKRGSGGSRTPGGIICADSPVFKPDRPLLWTRQPLFVWTGKAKSVRAIDATTKQIIWSKEVDANTHQLRLDRPLAFGKRYIWQVVTNPGNDLENPTINFQIVDATQWKKIDRELKALDRQLAQQKPDTERIALERAYYFAQKQMWGDVRETILSLPDRARQSENLTDLDAKIGELSECINL